jgi:hypothetical protein
MALIDIHGEDKLGTWVVTSPLLTNTEASDVNALVFLHRDPLVVIDAPPSTSMRASPASEEDSVHPLNTHFPIKTVQNYYLRCRERIHSIFVIIAYTSGKNVLDIDFKHLA